MTDEEIEPVSQETEKIPYFVYGEDAPIIRMELIASVAEAYRAYEKQGTFESLRPLYDVMWLVREEAKEAVRERGIPIIKRTEKNDKSSIAVMAQKANGKMIDGDDYWDGRFLVSLGCARYIDEQEKRDLGTLSQTQSVLGDLNYALLNIGFAALEVEYIGHPSLHIAMKNREILRTMQKNDESVDTHALIVEAQMAERAWEDAEEIYSGSPRFAKILRLSNTHDQLEDIIYQKR